MPHLRNRTPLRSSLAPDPRSELFPSPTSLRAGSAEALEPQLRRWLGARCTSRAVTAVEHLSTEPRPTYVEVGTLEQLDGQMWCVGGIFEPAGARDPWLVVHVRRGEHGVVVRRPCLALPQEVVIRVHDAATTAAGTWSG